MTDRTEGIRRVLVGAIGADIQSQNEDTERARLEEQWGDVWDTEQAVADFDFVGFMAPFVVAVRKCDNVKGSLTFQHSPRFYFNFVAV